VTYLPFGIGPRSCIGEYSSGIWTWQSRKSCAVVGQVHSWKLRGVVISHSFAFSASRRLKFSYKSILPCTAFPSTLVSMLELSPPLPSLLLLRIGGLSRLNTRAIVFMRSCWPLD
jgi:hypothetical protein